LRWLLLGGCSDASPCLLHRGSTPPRPLCIWLRQATEFRSASSPLQLLRHQYGSEPPPAMRASILYLPATSSTWSSVPRWWSSTTTPSTS
jgi:hypothetical protein